MIASGDLGRPRGLLITAAFASVALLLLLAAVPVRADVFSPIELESAGTIGGGELQQAEYAHAEELSADGQYVVFEGSAGGARGIWRVNLATREFQEVAGGEGEPAVGGATFDARMPSISADGRYVSFASNQSSGELVARTRGLSGEPSAGGGSEEAHSDQVYVRDMEAAPSAPGAFVVVSAVNESSEPLTYAESDTEHGSVAAAGSAISANGQEVAFVTTAVSNLLPYPQLEEEERGRGETPKPHTPPLQVAVRNLATEETTLVSGEYEAATGATSDRPVSAGGFGAVYKDQAGPTPLIPEGPEYSGWTEIDRPPGASISADGTTVAWMGQNVGLQARMLADEHPSPYYSEPLWRRIADPTTPIERVTGGSDPASPGCAESGQLALPEPPVPGEPCQGPFLSRLQGSTFEQPGIFNSSQKTLLSPGDPIPRLSGDGWKVVFLSRAEPAAAAGSPFAAQRIEGEPADLYVADMHPGLTRTAALTTLTALGGESTPEDAGISEFAISEDGDYVAFTTLRTQFRLADPAYVSAAASELGLNELFDVDLSDGTLTRVTHGLAGESSEQPHEPKEPGEETAYSAHPAAGATSPSFADGGVLLAFSSTASNLVAGDGNGPESFNTLNVGERDGADAFIVARQPPIALPTPQSISAPPTISTEPEWDLGATALSRADGSVVLYVRTPGPGSIRASASASLRVASRARGVRRARRSTHPHAGVLAIQRTVAASVASARAPEGELLTMVLRPGNTYVALTERSGGLSAAVTVQFAASGHRTLTDLMPVTFLRPPPRAHPAKRAHKAHARRVKR